MDLMQHPKVLLDCGIWLKLVINVCVACFLPHLNLFMMTTVSYLLFCFHRVMQCIVNSGKGGEDTVPQQ